MKLLYLIPVKQKSETPVANHVIRKTYFVNRHV